MKIVLLYAVMAVLVLPPLFFSFGCTSSSRLSQDCPCIRFKENIHEYWIYDKESKKSYISNEHKYIGFVNSDGTLNDDLHSYANVCLKGKDVTYVKRLFSIPLYTKGTHEVHGDKDCFDCLVNSIGCEKVLVTQCRPRVIRIGFSGDGDIVKRVQVTYDINGTSLDFMLGQ